jgi:hypothetical protein
MDFPFLKNRNFDPARIGKWCYAFWDTHFKTVFLLFTVVILIPALYFWYQNMYRSDWNIDQKSQYKNSQVKEVEFKEVEFKKVMKEIETKKQTYDATSVDAKDIFLPYPGDSDSGNTQ